MDVVNNLEIWYWPLEYFSTLHSRKQDRMPVNDAVAHEDKLLECVRLHPWMSSVVGAYRREVANGEPIYHVAPRKVRHLGDDHMTRQPILHHEFHYISRNSDEAELKSYLYKIKSLCTKNHRVFDGVILRNNAAT